MSDTRRRSRRAGQIPLSPPLAAKGEARNCNKEGKLLTFVGNQECSTEFC